MRLDNLPAGPEPNAPYAQSFDQRAAFRRDGLIRLRQVFAPHTLTRLKAAISGATLARSGERKPMAKRSTYAKAFLPVTNLWQAHAAARRFVFGKRLAPTRG